MSKTVVIQVKNTGNRLSYQDFFHFCFQVEGALNTFCFKTNFVWATNWPEPPTFACFIGELHEEKEGDLKLALMLIRTSFKQGPVSFMCGDAEFV